MKDTQNEVKNQEAIIPPSPILPESATKLPPLVKALNVMTIIMILGDIAIQSLAYSGLFVPFLMSSICILFLAYQMIYKGKAPFSKIHNNRQLTYGIILVILSGLFVFILPVGYTLYHPISWLTNLVPQPFFNIGIFSLLACGVLYHGVMIFLLTRPEVKAAFPRPPKKAKTRSDL